MIGDNVYELEGKMYELMRSCWILASGAATYADPGALVVGIIVI
jgi:hypothetical protein